MSSAPGVLSVPVSALRRVGQAGGVPDLEHDRGGGAVSRVICGKFKIDHPGGAALLELLPPLLLAPAAGRAGVMETPKPPAQAPVVMGGPQTPDAISADWSARRCASSTPRSAASSPGSTPC